MILSKSRGLAVSILALHLLTVSARGADFEVGDAVALEAAVAEAGPGDRVIMASGEWLDLDLELTFAGTSEAPVTLMAAEPGGTVLSGRTRLRLKGSGGVISGLRFINAVAPDGAAALVQVGEREVATSDFRITNCEFSDCNPADPETRYAWIGLSGRGHRVDHCLFSGQDHSGVTVQIRVGEPNPGHVIDHNLFRDRLPGTGNGFEMIQIGQSQDSQKEGGCTVEDNWFVRCDGETEIISSKGNGNVIRRNLFLESSGTVTLRHGNDSSVESNFFIGRGKAASGGVRVIGSGHRVRHNWFGGLTGRTGGVVVTYWGIPDSPLNGYFPASDALIESNVFEDNMGNGIYLNGGYGGRGRTLPPEGVVIRENLWRSASDGVVAVAGDLPGVTYEDNHLAGGVDVGVVAPEGILDWEEPVAVGAGPWAAASGGDVGLAEGWPGRQEVGPDWMLALPPLLLLEPARLLDLARSTGEEAEAMKEILIGRADAILSEAVVYSVTDNEMVPPSGNRHDYYSTGPYWWPDPDSPDGLPYIRIDGKFNPERDRVSDREPMHKMIKDVWVMALAYGVSGNERYAEWGHRLLMTWFLDPATAMTPNLRHAQAIPGVTDGRGTGVIDAHPFAELVDAISILESSPGFPVEDQAALRDWFTDYLNWLLYSPNGRDEADSPNNHGTAYDLQAAGLMGFLGMDGALRNYLETTVTARIDVQIEPDGAQPRELARTRTWSYCTENLEHFFKLGRIGQSVGVDLFAYESPGGASLQGALHFVLPAVCDPSLWTHPQETEWQDGFINVVLAIGEGVYDDESIIRARRCLTDAPNRLEAFVLGSAPGTL